MKDYSSRPSSVASNLSIRDPIESTKTLLSQANRFRIYLSKHTNSLTTRNKPSNDNPYDNSVKTPMIIST